MEEIPHGTLGKGVGTIPDLACLMAAAPQNLQMRVDGGSASWRGWEDQEGEEEQGRQKMDGWAGRTNAPHPVSMWDLWPVGIGLKIV